MTVDNLANHAAQMLFTKLQRLAIIDSLTEITALTESLRWRNAHNSYDASGTRNIKGLWLCTIA